MDRSQRNFEEKRTFRVAGMTCAACARRVETSLKKLEAVKFAAVNLATESAFVVLRKPLPEEELYEAVSRAGYRVTSEAPEDMEKKRYQRQLRSMALAWIITGPLMGLMFFHMGGYHVPLYGAMEIFGGALVLFGAGYASFRGAWIALSHYHANMDVLVVFGALAAWGTAVLQALGLPVASFGAVGAMIMGLHLTGRFIESWLRDRATREVRQLMDLQVTEVRLLDEEGNPFTVPLEAVSSGAVALLRPGERIPGDGVLLEGETSVDESMITGESMPVSKKKGDPLVGGSLNLTGSFRMEIQNLGEESFLSRMIALVQEAQGAKIPIQALADKITGFFVPLIISLALGGGLFWFFFNPRFGTVVADWFSFLPWVRPLDNLSMGIFVFVATVVIACPCALGLATPMALMVGVGRASRQGLIIRNAEAIQTARDIDTLVLDKTGTLTEGAPSVVEHTLSPDLLYRVAALEGQSNHPLAKAIASLGNGAVSLEVQEVHEIAGEGIVGLVEGEALFIGRPETPEIYREKLEQGLTVVEVRREGRVLGALMIADPLREGIAEIVSRLETLGILVIMATGDNPGAARVVAEQAGISRIYAGVRPEEKLDIVRTLQGEGKRVAMVGDGMNDAAALKGADVGIAMGSGTDLAMESADIVVVQGHVDRVLEALQISRRTFRAIRQNLFWA
ncbi:MAG TPA: cation-translocating P-type ATPase, partial [Synergistaceae bacterium]|nr:cation-translocating P-type ATPase [Synergistaceae bacterium]